MNRTALVLLTATALSGFATSAYAGIGVPVSPSSPPSPCSTPNSIQWNTNESIKDLTISQSGPCSGEVFSNTLANASYNTFNVTQTGGSSNTAYISDVSGTSPTATTNYFGIVQSGSNNAANVALAGTSDTNNSIDINQKQGPNVDIVALTNSNGNSIYDGVNGTGNTTQYNLNNSNNNIINSQVTGNSNSDGIATNGNNIWINNTQNGNGNKLSVSAGGNNIGNYNSGCAPLGNCETGDYVNGNSNNVSLTLAGGNYYNEFALITGDSNKVTFYASPASSNGAPNNLIANITGSSNTINASINRGDGNNALFTVNGNSNSVTGVSLNGNANNLNVTEASASNVISGLTVTGNNNTLNAIQGGAGSANTGNTLIESIQGGSYNSVYANQGGTNGLMSVTLASAASYDNISLNQPAGTGQVTSFYTNQSHITYMH